MVVGTTGRNCAALLVLAMVAIPARAQQTESAAEPAGDHTGADVQLVDHKRKYLVPDLPPAKPPTPEEAARKAEKFFTIRPSLAMLGDWTNYSQDAASVAQLGVQDDEFQVRSARLTFLGSIGSDYKVSYQVGGEYKGFDTDPEQNWQLTDLSLTFPLGARTKLTVGKTKETFSYEMVGDAANLPHSERVLSPFFVSRNFGARVLHVFGADKRATLSAGAYNDGWDINSKTSRGWDLTARATGLVWDDPANQRFLHLGLAYRHVASDGQLRYKGRAETNVGDNAVDTGNIAADGADHFGAEALLNVGPFSLLGEYVAANVDSPTLDDPDFSGWYLTGSWVITGETRPYDRNVGYARRVIPKGYGGAPELVVRFSSVDLDSGPVSGGSFDKTYLGVNWWATTRWKFGVGWGHTWLDRNGLNGESDTILTRVQWVY
jgi:phosphate-selective porin OprO and OprP